MPRPTISGNAANPIPPKRWPASVSTPTVTTMPYATGSSTSRPTRRLRKSTATIRTTPTVVARDALRLSRTMRACRSIATWS